MKKKSIGALAIAGAVGLSLIGAMPASAGSFGGWSCGSQWIGSTVSGSGTHSHSHTQGSTTRSTTYPTAGSGVRHSTKWGPAFHFTSSSYLTAGSEYYTSVGCAG
jgi:hypothetical protein